MDNPFAALLNQNKNIIDKNLIERVFLFTLRRDLQKQDRLTTNGIALLCLADVIINDSTFDTEMGEELLSHCIFERLMLQNPHDYLVPGENENDAVQTDVLLYLYRAYCTNKQISNQHIERVKDCQIIHSLIITNVTTYMQQPDIFPGRPIYEQWLSIMRESQSVESSELMNYLIECIQRINTDEPLTALGTLKANFYPVLGKIQSEIAKSSLVTLKASIFSILNMFVQEKRTYQMGELLIDYTTPNPKATGAEYMNTLFGNLFSISIIPKHQRGPYEFFADFTLETKHTNPHLWECMANHQDSVFKLIKQLLVQNPVNKQKTLQWFAKCLYANKSRGHLWNNLNGNLENTIQQNASDSFMIGLTSVLLRLCEPLCEPNLKVLLVDPTYCAVPEDELQKKSVNMIKAYEETCLLPTEETEKRVIAAKFNFVTELFFLTHKSFQFSYASIIERFSRVARDLHNLQTAYQDMVATEPNSTFTDNMLRMLKDQMQQYLCIRNCLMEPENDRSIVKFFEVTAIWLTEVALCSSDDYIKQIQNNNFAPQLRRNDNLPDDITFIPKTLQCVPENIMDNIVTYLSFTRHFPLEHYMHVYPSSHEAFFKMIILFMGHAQLVKNPHLRAKLAESLEAFLPQRDPINSNNNANNFLTHVFDTHPDRLKLVHSILNVFVSIEMTGQSVQFEQKFNYRRPMYAIMEYIWTKHDYVEQFRVLANEAEVNMDSIQPPLFLRFINLLINDAIFLLDESLNNLQQIRQLQESQTNGEWDNIPENERHQRSSNLHHLGMMARFDNILGRNTIHFLKLLTTEIKSIFCHKSMVDRITSMLNYFLLNLVGPQKEKFKVKDKKEFDFDPANMVLEICHIYINLSSSDSFCLAVSQDGRSYTSQLFNYTENILIRIGGGQLIGEMTEFAEKVRQVEKHYKQEQEFISEAPEEYLDPIMLTLMTDPVILPSSKVTVDRSTIARHLLSDQTDPFNRVPLTMDKVKPHIALKHEIENWLTEKRNSLERSSNNDSK